jgi:hypothetical protein
MYVYYNKNMDQEVAKLWLYGGNLSTAQTQIGIRTADNRNYTFIFDLRLVLGETMFQKYDEFKVYISYQNAVSSNFGLATLYQNGLNIVNASYQGKTAGFNTAISVYNQFQYVNDGNANIASTSTTKEFVIIKPNNTQVTLNISSISDTAPPNLFVQSFFLTFVPFVRDKIYKNPFNYLYQNELANFTLTTQILSAGATNEYGTMNSTFTTFTFTNVNMRRIIGTLWDKYDKFNLVCLNVGIGNMPVALSNEQRFLYFQIRGLQFINCLSTTTTSSYSQSVAYTPVFPFRVGSLTSEGDCFDIPAGLLSFRKPESETVDLAFQLFTAASGGVPIGNQFNQFSLTFAVVGIKE